MGVSTDAILWFGFEYGEEPPWFDTDPDDYEDEEPEDSDDWMARVLGIVGPVADYSEETAEEYQAHWKAKREAIAAAGVEVIHHCHHECVMYGLGVLKVSASRGYPENVSKHIAQDTAEAEAKLRAFCERAGVEWAEPGWHLASDWA